MTARLHTLLQKCVVIIALTVASLSSLELQAQGVSARQASESLLRAFQELPQYGVFDFIAFTLDRGVVTLAGYAYTPALKADAERVAKRVRGVDEIANGIEVLPASLHDDQIRQATFARIYTDSFLSRYSAGGANAALDDAIEFGRFPGRQPFGTYPIHIIVKHGRTTLLGVVDAASDKQLAEVRAREVGGVFSVSNELVLRRD